VILETRAGASPDEVYAELQKRLRLRARLPVYRRRVARSLSIIEDAIKLGTPIVMFSGGKDSTALLGLVATIMPDILAAFVDDGAQTEWTYQQVEAMRGRGYQIDSVLTQFTLVEFFQQVGQWGYEGENLQYQDQQWTQEAIRWLLIDEPAEHILNEGYDVHLVGSRAEESKYRRVNRNTRGHTYQKKSGQTICHPLADWETIDVFTYIVTHNLPLSLEYLQADDPLRLERRSASTLITDADPIGAKYWLRQRHPGLWQEYTRTFPRLRNRA
jgi:3'-phosphoadenosine 5'-phosphosulfate sulfotransferase (PAPS reductase)/FAD synthetase